ncbi:MAG: fibronectin type III domain-containing protein [Nitrospiraceae bacterium]
MWHDFTTNSVTVYVQSSGLAPGTYSGAITIWSDNAINAPKVVPVSLTVTAASAQPTIGFSPPSLSFTGITGGSNPAAQSITVTNAGTGTLTWTVADNANWLTATKAGGTIMAAVNLSGLAAGTYTSTITVSANGATNTPQTIPVSLTITAGQTPSPSSPSSFSVTPASIAVSVPAGTTKVQPFNFTVTSTGGSTSWAINDPAYWLLRAPSTGGTPTNVTGYIYPEFFKSPGTYKTTLVLTPSGSGLAPVSVPVTLTVTASATQPEPNEPKPPAQATLSLSPTSLAFSGTTGGSNPAAQSITVTNAGTGTLTWTVADNANWLTATKAGGTITAAVNLSGLAAGTYNGTITVAATGATNTPQSVPVTLTVNASGSTTGSVTLTWNGNGEQDLEGYKIYRATSSGAYGAPIATINGNVTSYVANGLPKGTTYFFVITAFDNAGNESSYSNEVSKSVY